MTFNGKLNLSTDRLHRPSQPSTISAVQINGVAAASEKLKLEHFSFCWWCLDLHFTVSPSLCPYSKNNSFTGLFLNFKLMKTNVFLSHLQ